ncbi:MAG: hypothetical protein ACI8PQ_001560 [Planctomycetota bacterium]|jgi:hypothetical protein
MESLSLSRDRQAQGVIRRSFIYMDPSGQRPVTMRTVGFTGAVMGPNLPARHFEGKAGVRIVTTDEGGTGLLLIMMHLGTACELSAALSPT